MYRLDEARELPSIRPDAAPYALEAIDEVVERYMSGARYVLRRILNTKDHEPRFAQENIAEHSWSVGIAAQTLWENRGELGITFDSKFDIGKVLTYANVHDLGETETEQGDIDAMCQDQEVLAKKKDAEIAGFRQLGAKSKYLDWIVDRGIEAEEKQSPETMFMSDVDKHVGIRAITLYAPLRWWGFAGTITTREDHTRIMRRKLLTPLGHSVFDAIESDFDLREVRLAAREHGATVLFPPTRQAAEQMQNSFVYQLHMGERFNPNLSSNTPNGV